MKKVFFKTTVTAIIALFMASAAYAQIGSSPEAVARSAFKAVAEGDVATLKSIMTERCFNGQYPMTDSQIRELLLSVPYEKRQILLKMADSMDAQVKQISDNSVIVVFTNKATNKNMEMDMIKIDGQWKIDDEYKW